MKELFNAVDEPFSDRITLDLDTKNHKYVIRVLTSVLKTKGFVGMKVKPSSSKGYHVIIYYKDVKSLRFKQRIRQRFDDKLRIYYDKKENPQNILFHKKTKFKTPRTI